MSIEHTTRAITENKYLMQLFADKKSLEADIAALKNLKWSNPSDPRTSDFAIKQKEYELSQIENRTKGKDYSSVKNQCEKYFTDNTSLFDKNQIITETRSMLAKGQIVNEWPHLAAVFLLDHAVVIDAAKAWLAAVTKPIAIQSTDRSFFTPAPTQSLQLPVMDTLWSGETIVPPTRPTASIPQKLRSALNKPKTLEEDLSEMFQKKQTMVFKDGAYYLTWPKGNTKRIDIAELIVNLNLPKNAPENLQKSVSLVQDFAFILDAYLLKNPEKKTQYDSTLKWIQADFANPDIQTGKSVLDIKKWTYTLFSNNNLLKNSDLYMANQAMDIKEPKARRFAILSFIRDRLGQSDLVAQKIMEDTMSKFWFPTDDMIVKNGDLSSTKLDAKQITKVREAIDKARSEANSNWMKNKDAYLKLFQAQNPGTTIDIEAARVANEKLTILMSAKREIAYQNLYNKKDLSPELALLQNILGAGSTKMSDKSWEISKEVAGMIGMEAIAIAAGMVTMGVGTVAINSVMFMRNGLKVAEIANAYNATSKVRQGMTTGARILGGGLAFEAGGATTRSLIENGDLTSMHSYEWYAQSIAMMGVMRGIGEVFTRTGILAFKEGAGFAKNILPFTGQVAIEGSAIFGTSAAIGSVLFDRRDNWTLEQMAQAMLMATMFKGASRVTTSKNTKGEIEIKQETSIQKPSNATENPWRYILDGQEYRWSSKNNEFIWKNGEKYTKEQFEKLQVEKAPRIEYKNNETTSNKPDISQFLISEITAKDVRNARNLIKNGEYPQFIAQDGSIWSIRSIKWSNGKEVVEIWPLGQPSLDKRATIQEFVEGVNANVRKFKETMLRNSKTQKITEPISQDKPIPVESTKQAFPSQKVDKLEAAVNPKTETVTTPTQEKPIWSKTENKLQPAPHIEATTAKNAIHKAENATIDHMVTPVEKKNFIAKYGAEKWEALSKSFKDAPKWIWNGAKSIFGVVTGIGRSTVSWKWATIGTAITEVIEASFNLNGTERDWNPMSEDGIKNIWGMLWQILAYRYMGFTRWFIVTEWYRVIPAVYTQVREANK